MAIVLQRTNQIKTGYYSRLLKVVFIMLARRQLCSAFHPSQYTTFSPYVPLSNKVKRVSFAVSYIHSTTHAEPELLSQLAKDKFCRKSFGGLSYLDTSNTEMFRVLFVLGGPGAGKGTQSALLEGNYPSVHLSVGELLRQEQSKVESPFREVIEQALVAGKIVPVEISLKLLQQAMKEKQNSMGKQLFYLVDGFPRNYDNLNGWCRVMTNVTALWGVLVYQCPLNVLEGRILKRAKDSGRSDDNLTSLRKRFRTFELDTLPIVNSLKDTSALSTQWSVIDIYGDQPLEVVWSETQSVFNNLILHDVITANVQLLEAVQNEDATLYESMCDPTWFLTTDSAQVLHAQEGNITTPLEVTNAQVEVVSGKHVILSYNRLFEAMVVREKRVWMHQGTNGWRNIHFSRTPIR